jgi:hypothetical protein
MFIWNTYRKSDMAFQFISGPLTSDKHERTNQGDEFWKGSTRVAHKQYTGNVMRVNIQPYSTVIYLIKWRSCRGQKAFCLVLFRIFAFLNIVSPLPLYAWRSPTMSWVILIMSYSETIVCLYIYYAPFGNIIWLLAILVLSSRTWTRGFTVHQSWHRDLHPGIHQTKTIMNHEQTGQITPICAYTLLMFIHMCVFVSFFANYKTRVFHC